MIEVTKFQTNDGELFDTREDAENHIVDKMRKVIDNYLTNIGLRHPEISRAAQLDMIEFLLPDYSQAKMFKRSLNKVFE